MDIVDAENWFNDFFFKAVTYIFICVWCVCVLVAQTCPTLCDPTNCSPWGFSVHGILQARILKWVAIPFSRGSSWPRDQTQVSHIARRFFTFWATGKPLLNIVQFSSVTQSCLTLCDPMNCSMPGLPVHHQLWSLPKLMSIESVMPSNHLILIGLEDF